MMDWMAEKGLRPAGKMWEVYLTDPEKENPERYMTKVFWLIEE